MPKPVASMAFNVSVKAVHIISRKCTVMNVDIQVTTLTMKY